MESGDQVSNPRDCRPAAATRQAYFDSWQRDRYVRISELTSTANLDSFVSPYFNVFVSVISAFNTLDTGQPFSAASASLSKVA
jgi:hypothetical protein